MSEDDSHDEPPMDHLGTIAGILAIFAVLFAVAYVGRRAYLYRSEIFEWAISLDPVAAGFWICVIGFFTCLAIALGRRC